MSDELRAREKRFSETEARLNDVVRRDYQRRLDTLKAMEAIAPSVFLERERLIDQQAYLKRFSKSKWLWGAVILGGILTYLEFSLGLFLLGMCGVLLIGTRIESDVFVASRLRSINERLSDLCYRWIANGLDEVRFWTFGRLEVRLSNSCPGNEVELQNEKGEWRLSVKNDLLSKAAF